MSTGHTALSTRPLRSDRCPQPSPIWTPSESTAAIESAASSTNTGSHHDRMTFSAPTPVDDRRLFAFQQLGDVVLEGITALVGVWHRHQVCIGEGYVDMVSVAT